MEQEYIDNYHRCIELTNLLYDYLSKKFDFKLSLMYESSYYTYFNYSDLAHPYITFKLNDYINVAISVNNVMYDKELPLYLHLWKYKGGDNGHYTNNIYFCDFLDNENFCLWCLDYINEFFGFNKINKGYKQLSIFDF